MSNTSSSQELDCSRSTRPGGQSSALKFGEVSGSPEVVMQCADNLDFMRQI